MKFGRNTAAVMPERAREPDWGRTGRLIPVKLKVRFHGVVADLPKQ